MKASRFEAIAEQVRSALTDLHTLGVMRPDDWGDDVESVQRLTDQFGAALDRALDAGAELVGQAKMHEYGQMGTSSQALHQADLARKIDAEARERERLAIINRTVGGGM